MNRITNQLPMHLLRPALACVAFAVLVATVTAAFLSPATASATIAPPPPASMTCEPTRLEARSARNSKATTKASKKSKKKAATKHLSGKLNINTATTEQLRMLPGVGPSKAERVIAYRKANGAFKRVKDLRRVKGFGYKSLKKLDPYLAVSGATTLQVASAPTASK